MTNFKIYVRIAQGVISISGIKYQRDFLGYMVTELYVYTHIPKYKKLIITDRTCSSAVYIQKGEIKYKFDGRERILSVGDSIYLPKGSSYNYCVLSDDSEIIQLNFDLLYNGKPYAFSDMPLPLDNTNHSIEKIFWEFADASISDTNALSLIFSLLSIIKETAEKPNPVPNSRLQPAVRYLKAHYCEKIPISHLCALCGLSESHFRRLFLTEYGVSPIKYKNRLICQTAIRLMKSENMSVSQVTDVLGIADIYTFSLMFKREIGKSPRLYLLEEKENPLS